MSIHATAEFQAPLAPHGAWIEVGSYGRCWRPARVEVGWRPYCVGHWVSTDCGWYWESDEPWAWACYHYGSWVDEPGFGWVWVPGVEWAPAWVSWRVGGGYCGWAPIHPRGIVVAAPGFVFVEARRFHEPIRPTTVIINNTRVVQQTTVIAGPARETRTISGAGAPQKVVINKGPDVALVQKASGKQFTPVPVRQVAAKADPPAGVGRREEGAKGKDKDKAAPAAPEKPAGQPTAPGRAPDGKPEPGRAPDQGKPAPPAPAPDHPDRVNPPLKPGAPGRPPNAAPDKRAPRGPGQGHQPGQGKEKEKEKEREKF